MKKIFISGCVLLVVPFLVVWFVPYLPHCEYGFINPLLNLLPSGDVDRLVSIALGACLLGYLMLLWWIDCTYKTRSWYFKLFQFLLVTILALFMVSILLASLNTARSKPANAFMKFYIASTRAYAEIYAENNLQNGYEGFCESKDFLFEQKRVLERTSSSEYCYVPTDMIRCVDAKEEYAISGKIIYKGKEGYFCADSADFVGEITSHVEGISCVRK